MPNETITREEFEERARLFLGNAIFEQQKDTIERCDCGDSWCTGWRIDAGTFGEPNGEPE